MATASVHVDRAPVLTLWAAPVGGGLARAALATTLQGARELLEQGTYRVLEHGRTAGDVNGMFGRERP